MDDLSPFFESLAGRRIPGGCTECRAEQKIEEVTAGVWSLTVSHERDCPVLRSRKARAN